MNRVRELERQKVSLYRLGKAWRDMAVARWELSEGHYEWAVFRSYYVVFKAIRAFVGLKSSGFRSEENEIRKFDKYFVSKNLFPLEEAQIILPMKTLKERVEWEDFLTIKRDEAKASIVRAERFLNVADELLTSTFDKAE
jgi:uncharacterized protein (UPF0332 family)